MKKLYIESIAVLLLMTFIIIAAFKVPQSNYYLAAICVFTIGLAVWGISLGITMADKFGDKK